MGEEKGYIYHGTLQEEELQKLRARFPGVTLSFDLAHLDFSGELRDEGSTFGESWEIRWRRLPGGQFDVLVLSEKPVTDIPLPEVPGPWDVRVVSTRLLPLSAPWIAPQFSSYPEMEPSPGKLRCAVYVREGVTYFVSPRRVAS